MEKKGLIIGASLLALGVGAFLLLKKKPTAAAAKTPAQIISSTAVKPTQIGPKAPILPAVNPDYVLANPDGTTTTFDNRDAYTAALDAQNAVATAKNADINATGQPRVLINGIPSDLYNTYLNNQAGYAAAGKPPPIHYDESVPGQITAIPYNDPTAAVTYSTVGGTPTFTNVNGTPVASGNVVIIKKGTTIPVLAEMPEPIPAKQPLSDPAQVNLVAATVVNRTPPPANEPAIKSTVQENPYSTQSDIENYLKSIGVNF